MRRWRRKRSQSEGGEWKRGSDRGREDRDEEIEEEEKREMR